MSLQYHITSLVVHLAKDAVPQFPALIDTITGAQLHAITDEGKCVITLEGDSQREILDNIESINAHKGVLNTSLIYHSTEPVEQLTEHH